MKTKIFTLVMALTLVLGIAGFAGSAEAQVAFPFPAGCSSGLGYSITTGTPCNGTGVATMGPIVGCTTALGYSNLTGVPCSGTSLKIDFLAGCSSLIGYSTIDTKPCNGRSVATTFPASSVSNPGLPTTGAGGNSEGNIALLLASALVAALGIGYLVRKPSTV